MRHLSVIHTRDIAKGTRVIVRADFDVAERGGAIEDDTRIRAHEATIRMLINAGAHIRIVAHRGRPVGRRDSALTMAPVSRLLSRILKRPVASISDPFSPAAYEKFNHSGEVLLFENIRFWPGEEKNSAAFARSLARWGDIYVNEAFAVCHRAHASVVRLPNLLPSYAGLHLAREVAAMERVMKNPRRPLIVLLGGVKIETKLPLIRRFLRDADYILIGGALASTIFSLMGLEVGKSRVDRDVRIPLRILTNRKILLPADVTVTHSLAPGSAHRACRTDEVRRDEYIVDIGFKTRARFAALIRGAGTVVWNGPVGLVEAPEYAAGTHALAGAMADENIFTVVGGGDTIAALRRLRVLKRFDHVSTGGGAMLEFLAGKKLPGIEALKKI